MLKKNDSLETIRQIINDNETIILCGHTNPDGDAIGASLSLASALELAGKKVGVLLEAYSGKYDLIPNGHLVIAKEDIQEVDLFISLDCGDMGRLAGIEDVFQKAKTTMNIDHHESNTFFADYNYVVGGASSTSELVFHLIDTHFPMTKEIALGLYTGLIYDTAGFRHSSTTPVTMDVAGKLMAYDIPFSKVYNAFFDARSFSETKLMARGLEHTQLHFHNKVVTTTITLEDIAQCNGSHKELDGIVNYINGIDDVEIACFFYEKTEQEVKVSFRGKDGYDVSALAQKFGGGGHVKASGCTLNMSIKEAQRAILNEIQKII